LLLPILLAERTSELPGSTVWVQLPDPVATAQQLEECAEALEQGLGLVENFG